MGLSADRLRQQPFLRYRAFCLTIAKPLVAIVIAGLLTGAVGCGSSSGQLDSAQSGPPATAQATAQATATYDGNSAAATATEFRHRMGTVLAGATLSHAFLFANNESEAIRI